MTPFRFTPNEGSGKKRPSFYTPVFLFTATFRRPLPIAIIPARIICGLILVVGLLSSQPALAGNDSGYYIKKISYNDEHTLDRRSIDSLYQVNGQIDLPPIKEIEIEIGLPEDSLKTGVNYRLVGFEDDWNHMQYNIVRYTNLSSRQYKLKIRHPITKEDMSFLVFFPAKPGKENIREEWWFQPLLIFCLLLILFTIAYFLALDRSRRSLRLEMVRNQIASDLHDDVGANLGAINNLTDLLKKRHDQQDSSARSKIIERIKNYTRDTITNLQDTVWAINPLNDSIEELLVKMREFAFLMLGAKDIELSYESHYDTQHPIQMDMQQRHAMFMMFKEVINNIVKHSGASQVSVDIRNNRTSLTIAVQDNGVGFDPDVLHRGNGLKNFRNRARENFIDLKLDSAPGAGAHTHMTIHSLA